VRELIVAVFGCAYDELFKIIPDICRSTLPHLLPYPESTSSEKRLAGPASSYMRILSRYFHSEIFPFNAGSTCRIGSFGPCDDDRFDLAETNSGDCE
jgi:hypothetical protein